MCLGLQSPSASNTGMRGSPEPRRSARVPACLCGWLGMGGGLAAWRALAKAGAAAPPCGLVEDNWKIWSVTLAGVSLLQL